MSVLQCRNPWLKLAAIYFVAVPLAAAIAYTVGDDSDALGTALTAVALGVLTGVIVWMRGRSADHQGH